MTMQGHGIVESWHRGIVASWHRGIMAPRRQDAIHMTLQTSEVSISNPPMGPSGKSRPLLIGKHWDISSNCTAFSHASAFLHNQDRFNKASRRANKSLTTAMMTKREMMKDLKFNLKGITVWGTENNSVVSAKGEMTWMKLAIEKRVVSRSANRNC